MERVSLFSLFLERIITWKARLRKRLTPYLIRFVRPHCTDEELDGEKGRVSCLGWAGGALTPEPFRSGACTVISCLVAFYK